MTVSFFVPVSHCDFFLFFFQCEKFVNVGAELGMTPSDVVATADITFSCVADPQAAKEVSIVNADAKKIFFFKDMLLRTC